MPVELVEVGTSAGVGVVDNLLVELEERGVITGKATYVKDGLRIVGAFGGLVVSSFVARPGTALDKVSSALGISALPLAMHSIRNLAKKVFKSPPVAGREEYVLERVGVAAAPSPAITSAAVVTSY
jgi:hypothetical protein